MGITTKEKIKDHTMNQKSASPIVRSLEELPYIYILTDNMVKKVYHHSFLQIFRKGCSSL